MMRHTTALLMLIAATATAQEPVSLRQAVALALTKNKAITAGESGVRAAESRVAEARSGFLPKLNYSEAFARSDNPVFVFSSLLTQHQFAVDNFQVDRLNRPGFLNNFQSQLMLDQVVYDGGQIRKVVHSAQLSRSMGAEELRRTQMDVIANTVRAYYGALLSAQSLETAREAVRSAEADLTRAESVRTAGLSTDVDVLSIRVHLAAVREQRIRREADLDVARAALNDALGLPLDTKHDLAQSLAPLVLARTSLENLERSAIEAGPEAKQAKYAAAVAETQVQAARSSYLPQVGARAVFEADRQRFIDRGGANWMVGVSLKWNLFNGFGDRARIQDATYSAHRAQAEEERMRSAVSLQVRRAWADLRAADERIAMTRESVAQAEESLRITQNRYGAGMATVTDLLRTETALLESRTRHLTAVHDQRIETVMLEYAAGTLTVDSGALN